MVPQSQFFRFLDSTRHSIKTSGEEKGEEGELCTYNVCWIVSQLIALSTAFRRFLAPEEEKRK